MPKSRIESLLTSFPKLIPAGSQHTSVETADVRYVYQPLEDLYILIITNKASNILQDIETLHLFARVTSDMCRSADEKEIHRNAFEVLGAFDEIVSLGYREQVNLMQIRSVLEMESHEEKIQEIIARNKEAEAKEELKRRAKQLEMQRREQARRQQGGGNIGGGATGYSSIPRFEVSEPVRAPASSAVSSVPTKAPAFKGSGMKLGKKGKQSDLIDALGTEISTPVTSIPNTPQRAASPERPRFQLNVEQESVHVTIREQLSLTLNQAGGLKSLSLKGDLNLLISEPSLNKIKLALLELSDDYGSDLQFKYHPNLFKGPEAERGGLESEVRLKDGGRSWPVGQPLGVLRWKLAGKDESFVPLSINCWPTPTGDGTTEVNIEYELESDRLKLHDVTISIPLPDGFPKVGSHTGSYSVDPSTNALVWSIPLVSSDSDKSGSMEFTIDGDDTTAFFPVKVDFTAEGSLVGVGIDGVTTADGSETLVFSQEVTCTTDEYTIV
ncbi:hypothetical protein M407DRAFT_123121 [Tulasnella calospora MUT 4182]|uniref:Coatomer subunit delta n=1 Tax=Tulasnella calospora MUT 4182 TaxID=1051891 RepID=A0A0C3Q179_9AGAM|nr:hypothetical protein M407DRAFT_123121 [Tulasnella calospora MUT 4182]